MTKINRGPGIWHGQEYQEYGNYYAYSLYVHDQPYGERYHDYEKQFYNSHDAEIALKSLYRGRYMGWEMSSCLKNIKHLKTTAWNNLASFGF